ncbi:hypothetical protein [Mariprofundus sp. KV]|uniref:hypothetical protein n=1 Tax=Mariprofundus sp. KV TaxID=2608715 RepID=UPI0015A27067|nr:hypothetical protein [Mariprofundus sp. KV]NWF37254.1 hypothetical protein [Mariprofundus sp. KV]
MLFVREQKENRSCLYQAHVWFTEHSHQCGCFTTLKAAEHWANWLQKEIVTRDLFKAIHNRSGQ